jgi:hypothetical protein
MRDHVKILAILHIAFGALGVLAALILLAVFGGIAGILQLTDAGGAGAVAFGPFGPAGTIVGLIGAIVAVVVLVISLPGLIAGIGLLSFQPWARILMIILCVLELPGVPFHTAMGIYGLWVLLSNEGAALFSPPMTARA